MLEFTKMQGAGNDFILFDGAKTPLPEHSALARAVCDRRFGVGADGILIADRSDRADLIMRYYNSDGSRAALCGNGLRCFARYARERGLVTTDHFIVDTAVGPRQVWIEREDGGEIGLITVEVDRPELVPYEIPVLVAGHRAVDYPLCLAGDQFTATSLRVGVPHTVLFVNQPPKEERLRALGEAIGHHPAFPQGCNLDLVLPQGDCLKIFTWERGAGHTLACGTGCCAAAAAGWLTGRVEASRVRLETEGGVLWVSRKGEMLLLTGPAETVCSGVFAAKWRAEQNG